jgi:LysM repeat protein
MSSSFQSTAYQSFAQPVDTFVQPVNVLPKTDMMALADTLKVINPALEKFIETKIEEKRAEISEEALNDALDSSTKDWADASKYVRDNKLFSGNRLYNKVFQRTKATIIGGSLESKFKTEYETATVNGVPLSNFSLDSLEFSDWLNQTRSESINLLGDVDSDTFNKKFFPYLVNATTKITDIHEEKHEAFQLEKLKINASNIVKNVILFQTAGPDSDLVSKDNFLLLTNSIEQFENDINKLGLDSKSRSSINKTILNSLSAEAKRIGFNTGDVDLALSIFKSASQFPFGPNGQLTLLDHPDYVEMENKLREDVEDYTDKKDRRDRDLIKREKENALELGMLNAASLIDQGKSEEAFALIDDLAIQFPLLATKIQANAEILGSGDTNERYGTLIFNIQNGNYSTLSEARIAAWAWYSDPSTIKNDTNTNRLTQAMVLAGSVDKGVLEPLNEYFGRFEDQAKLIIDLDTDFKTFKLIGADQQLATIKLNLEAFKSELREYRLANPSVGRAELDLKYEELKEKYNKKIRSGLETLLNPSDTNDTNSEFITQNQGLEGVATGDGTNNEETTDGTNNEETGDFFGNTSLPSVESKVVKELIRMGGITKENRDKLIELVKAEKEKMNFTNIVGKSEADRIIRFLQTGQYGYGFKGESLRIYEPVRLLIDDFEAGAFTEGGVTTFEVESGDTLSGIANDLDTSVEAIKKANGLTNDTIQIGEILVIPEGITDLNKVNAPEFDINQLITEKDHPFLPVRRKHNFQVVYNLAKKAGIKFPEVVAAQFGVESVFGSKVTGTNNYFGIKADPQDIKTGNFTEADTFEEIDGKKVKVRAKFKNFKSLEESIQHYKKFWNDDFKDRKGIVNVNTSEQAIIRLKENGYATDSDYVKLVTDVLNDAIRDKFF